MAHLVCQEGLTRPCVDYHALIKLTIENKFSTPHIEDTLEPLNGAKVISETNHKVGYHKVRIVERYFQDNVPNKTYPFWRCGYGFSAHW